MYTYELLEYLEALDPGRTWTKDQLMQNLQGIVIKRAHGVSCQSVPIIEYLKRINSQYCSFSNNINTPSNSNFQMASSIKNDDKEGIAIMKRSLQQAKDLQNVMVKWNIKK